MTTFESSIKVIPFSQEAVYNKISDLNNLEQVKDRIPQDKIQNFEFDSDSINFSVSPMGSVCLRIIEREPYKLVKFETANSPLPFNLWIQLVAIDDTQCKMKITVKAELNPFIKGMISKPLQEGLEKMAEMIAQIPFK
ncbi:MAG: SRPBCC family protein [Bacteroidaceae bacterium]|nr:SRPBCC family protein [Bacteroidaceae bacterium]